MCNGITAFSDTSLLINEKEQTFDKWQKHNRLVSTTDSVVLAIKEPLWAHGYINGYSAIRAACLNEQHIKIQVLTDLSGHDNRWSIAALNCRQRTQI